MNPSKSSPPADPRVLLNTIEAELKAATGQVELQDIANRLRRAEFSMGTAQFRYWQRQVQLRTTELAQAAIDPLDLAVAEPALTRPKRRELRKFAKRVREDGVNLYPPFNITNEIHLDTT